MNKKLQDFIIKEVRNYVAINSARPYVMLDKEVPDIKIPKPVIKSYDNKNGIATMILTCDLAGSPSSKLYRAILSEDGQLTIEEFGRMHTQFIYPTDVDLELFFFVKEKTND